MTPLREAQLKKGPQWQLRDGREASYRADSKRLVAKRNLMVMLGKGGGKKPPPSLFLSYCLESLA